MKPSKFEYVEATSIEQALHELAQGDSRLLAGGQSLIPIMNFRLAAPARLIDLGRVEALKGIGKAENGDIIAGAMTRHRDFETSLPVRQSLPLLPHALASVAHIPIRNRGTIGGSLAHADPAGDWPALCLACETSMSIRSLEGDRTVSAEEFSLGVYETAIQPGELLVQVRFPAWPAGRRWGVQKMMRRRGDFALAGVVCLVDLDQEGRCAWARIVLQGVADAPVVAREAQSLLLGKRPDALLLQAVARAARDGVETRSDIHASSEYRAELIDVLTRRALSQALSLQETH
ncbi:MAG: FAD binding domain-containing protein [Noviherbaspirillum sp.]